MILLPGSEYMIIGSKAIISLVSGISQKRRITNVIQRFWKVPESKETKALEPIIIYSDPGRNIIK